MCQDFLEVGVTEKVDHPAHYGGDVKFEAIKIIEDWGLGFSAGNALKYIIRAPHKGSEIEDLKKALWYLNRAREFEEGITLNKLSRWVRSLFGFSVMPADTLKAAEVNEYWRLSIRLGSATHYLAGRDFASAIPFVQDELTLRVNQEKQAQERRP